VGSLDRQALETFVVDDLKQPKFRAKQLREWIYDKGVDDFGNMTNLPAKWRTDMSARGLTVGGTIAGTRAEQVSQKNGLHLVASRLRHGLHVLRDGPDGLF
jgi:adenine C2-methylase RlmN of 23S rRNA A2503 and tRNA A37